MVCSRLPASSNVFPVTERHKTSTNEQYASKENNLRGFLQEEYPEYVNAEVRL